MPNDDRPEPKTLTPEPEAKPSAARTQTYVVDDFDADVPGPQTFHSLADAIAFANQDPENTAVIYSVEEPPTDKNAADEPNGGHT